MRSNVQLMVFGFFKHSKTRRHRRDRRRSAHHVFAERHVHVSDRKENEHIKHGMVDSSNGLYVTKEGEHPTEIGHPAGIPPPSLGIQSQAGDDDNEATEDEHRKHRQLRQRVMSGIFRRCFSQEEVVSHLCKYALPPFH